MNTLKPTLVTLFVLLISYISFSQTTIWTEDFSSYPDVTIDDSPRWTITPSASVNTDLIGPGGAAYLSHFWVVSGNLEAQDTNGEEQVFETETMDISAFINVNMSINVSEVGDQENSDYIDIYYVLDGGGETLFATNGQNNDDFTAQTTTQSGISGNNLKIVIRVQNNEQTEFHYINDILVQGLSNLSPGAVENNLQLWMRADEGIGVTEAIDNTEVSIWDDQSVNTYSAAKEGNGPIFIEESLNFNPALRFTRGDDTYLNLGQAASLDIIVGATPENGGIRSDITMFAAFLTDGSGAGTILAKGNNNVRSYQLWLGDTDRVVHYTWGRDEEDFAYDSRNWGMIHGRNEPKFTTGTVNAAGYKSNVNGIEDTMVFDQGVGNGWATTDVMIGARRDGNGTSNTGFGNVLSGDVSEIIMYDRELTPLEIQKVESYLAIKYGITMGYNDEFYESAASPQTSATSYSGISNDYIASNGSVLWDGATNAGYGYNVFGIARDDNSNLNQIKSKSSNVQRIEISPGVSTFLDAILTIETGSIDDDLSYLLVGHNGQDIVKQTTSLPVRSVSLLDRIWRARESNTDTGLLTLIFDLNQYVPAEIPNPENLHLFVADNTSFTGYCNYEGTIAGNVLTFSGVNLTEGDYFTLGEPTVLAGNQDIFFDGVNSYITAPTMLQGKTGATIMGWIKLDLSAAGSNIYTMGGEEAFYIYVPDSLFPVVETVTNSGTYTVTGTAQVQKGEWIHLAAVYDAASTTTKIYMDGIESAVDNSVGGTSLSNTVGTINSTFAIGKNGAEFGSDYFYGDIDEVKVFDIALTENELRKMIFQEVELNGVNVRGKIIPKDIDDDTTGLPVPWNNMLAYYAMSSVKGNIVFDESTNTIQGKLNNVANDIKAQTAPLPFTTTAATDLSLATTFTNGSVWNISNLTDIDWSILQVNHNVTTNSALKTLGLFLNSGNSITVTGDTEVNNSWYLELNGTLDLADDSQLIQGPNSDLVTTVDGKILRRQEGNINVFWYNYWSSPVGTRGVTSLIDNNTTSNNVNNTPFYLDMLTDGTAANIPFTNAFDQVGSISDQWLYTFQNGLTFWDWAAVDPTMTSGTPVTPGIGYTQKGTGNTGTEQQYIFEGKPNNGTILLPADDVDGDGAMESVEDVTLTTSMFGNPYPSALDARQFINDNAGIIQGTILLWEQWAGTSHLLAEYEGGYGFINNLATERAYQYPGIPIADQVLTQGIKIPTFYIPVGQGFFVEIVNDGNVEFNNGQRVFIKESDSDGVNPNNGSLFFRNGDSQTSDSTTENRVDEMMILRLEFGVSSGASRSFVLGFSNYTTDGFDYGYDGGLITSPPSDDMGSILNGDQYVIQAFAPITPEKEVNLIMHSSGSFTHTLKSTEITNIPEGQDLFIRDNLTSSTYDLRSTEPYNFTSVAGTFTDRFEVIFTDPTLSVSDEILNNLIIYMDNVQDKLYIKSLDEDVKNITLTNLLGQTVKTFSNLDSNTLENGLHINGLSSGIYLVNLTTENNSELTKKIILD